MISQPKSVQSLHVNINIEFDAHVDWSSAVASSATSGGKDSGTDVKCHDFYCENQFL